MFLWDIKENELLNSRMGSEHTDNVLSVSFSPNGSMLLSSGMDRTVCVCKVNTGERLHRFLGHKGRIRFSNWSSDGNYVASASDDSTVRIWQIEGNDDQTPQILEHGEGSVRGVAFSPNGKHIATCGKDRKIVVWVPKEDNSGWSRQYMLEGHSDWVLSVLVSPDSKQIFSSGLDKTIRVWDMETGKISSKFKTDQPIEKMWFDEHWSSHIMTPYGAKSSVNSSRPSQAPSWSPYWRLYKDDGDEWIMWYEKKVIFLPE